MQNIQRALRTLLLYARCPRCNNLHESIPELKRLGCWCELSKCISCTEVPIAQLNLCSACNEAYLKKFHLAKYLPKSYRNVNHWVRNRFNTLYRRHGFRGGDGAYAKFVDWWNCAHRSYRLHFQNRARRFEIHRANDIGYYELGAIFMIPQTENNLIRDYCRIDEFNWVIDAKLNRQLTYAQIEEIVSIPKATANRYVNQRIKIITPIKCRF